jgi:hypothetical protein
MDKMKATRKTLVQVAVSLAVMLMVGVALQRSWRAVPRPGGDAGKTVTAASDSLSRPEADAPVMNLPTTSFLAGLSARLTSIRSEPDSARQEEMLESLAQSIGSGELKETLTFLQRDETVLNQALSLGLIRRWTEHSPKAAADWVLRSGSRRMRLQSIESVATVWANADLAGAVEWVRQLPFGEEQQSGLLSIGYEAARNEPLEALRLALMLPANQARADLIVHSANQWAAADPEAAAKWANQIAEEPLRAQLLAGIAATWGERDPVAAATLAVNNLPPGKQQDDAVVGIVQRWVQKAPEEASAWVTEFPEGPLRDLAWENLLKIWADQDVQQAAQWLDGLPLSPSRDLAVGAFVTKVTPASPEVAARWAESIGDEGMRIRQMETVAEAWMSSDVAIARVWIAQAPLPEGVKERLLALKSL